MLVCALHPVRQCFTEACLSSVLKGSILRLDLAKFTSGKLFYPNVPMAIESCASGTRPPLRLPSRVAELLETKHFFARADVATVAGLYRDFFEAVVPACRELQLSGLGWVDAEATELTAALPEFTNLATLDLSKNSLGAEGCKLLASILETTGITNLKCVAFPQPASVGSPAQFIWFMAQ